MGDYTERDKSVTVQEEVLLLQHAEGCVAVQRVGGALQVLLHDLTSVEKGVERCRALQ